MNFLMSEDESVDMDELNKNQTEVASDIEEEGDKEPDSEVEDEIDDEGDDMPDSDTKEE